VRPVSFSREEIGWLQPPAPHFVTAKKRKGSVVATGRRAILAPSPLNSPACEAGRVGALALEGPLTPLSLPEKAEKMLPRAPGACYVTHA